VFRYIYIRKPVTTRMEMANSSAKKVTSHMKTMAFPATLVATYQTTSFYAQEIWN